MKRYGLRVELGALRDIDDAYEWLAEQSQYAADGWFQGLWATIEALAVFPQRGSPAREAAVFKQDVRQLLYGRGRGVYRILYTVAGDTVVVNRVRHASRATLIEED